MINLPKKQYSLGFVFTPNFEKVLLIEKTHPYFQAGKLNGLGGKCEKGELPLICMSREMQEESGVAIAHESWQQITSFSGDDWQVTVFSTIWQGKPTVFHSTTEETIDWYEVEKLPSHCMENLPELIGLCVQNY